MSRLGRSTETFFRLPTRVGLALEHGELSLSEFALLCGLVHLAYLERSRRIEARLETIHARLNWPHGREYLRQTLHALATKKWVDLDTQAGRSAWVITLDGAEVATEVAAIGVLSGATTTSSDHAAATGPGLDAGGVKLDAEATADAPASDVPDAFGAVVEIDGLGPTAIAEAEDDDSALAEVDKPAMTDEEAHWWGVASWNALEERARQEAAA